MNTKSLILGVGFLFLSVVVAIMFEKFLTEIPWWFVGLLGFASIVFIIYGLTPSKVKEYKDRVALIWPTHIQYAGESKITRVLRRFRKKH